MGIPLPNLDDRRWADLVEEGRALIPLYAPDWTDHNVHDPGITLIELFAWIAEMDIYQLNRIPDRYKLKFLSLVGVSPRPAQPARSVLGFSLDSGTSEVALPPRLECGSTPTAVQPAVFQTVQGLRVIPGQIETLQSRDTSGYHGADDYWLRDGDFPVFGPAPIPGSEFYIGFSDPFPQGTPVTLYFQWSGGRSGVGERKRILSEEHQQRLHCNGPINPCQTPKDAEKFETETPMSVDGVLQHHAVRTEWEYLAVDKGESTWAPLCIDSGHLRDETRGFTLDGTVAVTVPSAMAKKAIGISSAAVYYLRCRFQSGAYDSPPLLKRVVVNGVLAEQASSVSTTWPMEQGSSVQGDAPKAGDLTSLYPTFEENGTIVALKFDNGNGESPLFLVLDYQPPTTSSRGILSIEGDLLGLGLDVPAQEMDLSGPPLLTRPFRLNSLEEGEWFEWIRVEDFSRSTRADRHFTLDESKHKLTFGDGEKGRTLTAGAVVLASYETTGGYVTGIEGIAVNQVLATAHNQALFKNKGIDPEAVLNSLRVANPAMVKNGQNTEPLTRAIGRAKEIMQAPTRAVTLDDYESLVLSMPGVNISRVKAVANFHSSFVCMKAPGVITVVIVPDMPVPQPFPDIRLRNVVRAYLARRRIVGTRIEVAGPTYREVSVFAKAKARTGASIVAVRDRIETAINTFLDPQKWPFGRDVYRSEVLQIIDQTEGVDYVEDMELAADGCEPQCGNICLAPTWLVSPGKHEVEVNR